MVKSMNRFVILAIIFLVLILITNSSVLAGGSCSCCLGDVNDQCGGDCTFNPDDYCNAGETPESSTCGEIEPGLCGSGFCTCIPEFSDYTAIIALIGAVLIPVLIYKFKRKKS